MTTEFGISDSADFEQNTWTFSMEGDYRVGAGRYAILTIREYESLLDLADVKQEALSKTIYEKNTNALAIAARAREECANLLDGNLNQVYENGWTDAANERKRCAAAIRAMGSEA